MFANLKFRDEFSFPVAALLPQNRATGSYGGGVVPVAAQKYLNFQATSAGPTLGNYANYKKWVAIVLTGSGGATSQFNAWWGGASGGSAGSGGTFSALPASSTSTFSGSQTYVAAASAQYGSAGVLVMEIRGEYLQGLNSAGGYGSTGITWIQPIVSISGVSAYTAILTFAFDSGTSQASLYDVNAGAYVLQETDAF